VLTDESNRVILQETVPEVAADSGDVQTQSGEAAELNGGAISEGKPDEPPVEVITNERKGIGKGVKAAIWTCAAVAAVFAAFVLVSRLMPGSTDFLLYSNDEIEILRAAGL
ncbi:MAG: hypothetical protein ACI395_10640, partial [Candidatus Cryptobacteroides sp.]